MYRRRFEPGNHACHACTRDSAHRNPTKPGPGHDRGDRLPDIRIPESLKPSDGRFGSGPSKVRPAQVDALASVGTTLLGTSHRQRPVKALVGRLRSGLREMFSLPDGYEVLLGNGGTTAFWDAATFCLISRRSEHLSFGEFSSKFAAAAAAAPHLDDPVVIESPVGTRPEAKADATVDTYALTHNETSTGVAMAITRPAGVAVPTDGGPEQRARVRRRDLCGRRASRRPVPVRRLLLRTPEGLRLRRRPLPGARVPCRGRQDRTARLRQVGAGVLGPEGRRSTTRARTRPLNTPALATLVLMAEQLDWMLELGGLEATAARCDRSAEILYTWAEQSDFATPFVDKSSDRSHVVGTIDFVDAVDAVDGREGASSERDRGHRALPQARSQPAPHRHVPRHRTRRHREPVRLHQLRRGGARRLSVASKTSQRRSWRPYLPWIDAAAFSVSGIVHLAHPATFTPIVPRFLPFRTALVYASGVAELVCAVGLWRRDRWAGIASAVLLVAIWPANLQDAITTQQGGNLALKIVDLGSALPCRSRSSGSPSSLAGPRTGRPVKTQSGGAIRSAAGRIRFLTVMILSTDLMT